MKSRERFQKVFAGQLPDRVPVTLFILEQGEFIEQIRPDLDPWDFEANQLAIIEFQRQMGLDVFLRVLFSVDDPEFIHYCLCVGLNVSTQTEHLEVSRT